MATNHEIWVAYVNEDKTLDTRRVPATDCDLLSDIRDVIQIRFRKVISGQFFEDLYSGWPCFKIDRGRGPQADFANILQCRPKQGPTQAAARQISYHDHDFVPNENAMQRDLPDNIVEASMGGSGARLYGYDIDAADFQDLVDQASAMSSEDTPLTTA
jgi:hypothetical protein